ncbi:MAG: hypothetical protein ACRCW1_01150 [Anaerotignaceae bacterium]
MSQNICTESFKKELLGALIGLGRATKGNKNRPNSETHKLLLLGFEILNLKSETSLTQESALVKALHIEKYNIVSKCLSCKKQCGRNDDYKMESLEHISPDMRIIKLELLALLMACANYINKPFVEELLYQESLDFLYYGLFIFGSDLDEDTHKDVKKNGSSILYNLINRHFK